MSGLTRRAARECAVKMLYGYEFSKESEPEDFFDFNCAEAGVESDDFSRGLFLKTVANLEEIDASIERCAKGWKLSRISKMTLSILRLCICEMKYYDEIPDAVSMNEAVELAKLYDDDDAPAFINGIVNTVAGELK